MTDNEMRIAAVKTGAKMTEKEFREKLAMDGKDEDQIDRAVEAAIRMRIIIPTIYIPKARIIRETEDSPKEMIKRMIEPKELTEEEIANAQLQYVLSSYHTLARWSAEFINTFHSYLPSKMGESSLIEGKSDDNKEWERTMQEIAPIFDKLRSRVNQPFFPWHQSAYPREDALRANQALEEDGDLRTIHNAMQHWGTLIGGVSSHLSNPADSNPLANFESNHVIRTMVSSNKSLEPLANAFFIAVENLSTWEMLEKRNHTVCVQDDGSIELVPDVGGFKLIDYAHFAIQYYEQYLAIIVSENLRKVSTHKRLETWGVSAEIIRAHLYAFIVKKAPRLVPFMMLNHTDSPLYALCRARDILRVVPVFAELGLSASPQGKDVIAAHVEQASYVKRDELLRVLSIKDVLDHEADLFLAEKYIGDFMRGKNEEKIRNRFYQANLSIHHNLTEKNVDTYYLFCDTDNVYPYMVFGSEMDHFNFLCKSCQSDTAEEAVRIAEKL